MLARSLPEWMIRMFRVPYPTSRWERALPPELEVEFEQGTLCGVALGDDVERLAFLGPADSPGGACAGVLGYSDLGLALVSDSGKLGGVTLLIAGSPGAAHRPFEGCIRARGQRHLLTTGANELEIVTRFGTPTEHADQKDDETGEVWERSLRYVSGGVLREVVFDPDGSLIEINIEPYGEA